MPPQRLGEPTLPSPSLSGQLAEIVRRFGPAHRVRDEFDAVLRAALTQVAVEADNELDVFADRVGRPTTHGFHERAAEETERPGDDQQRADPAPADPPDEKGAKVFDHLHRRELPAGETHLRHATVLDDAAVCDSDDAAGGRNAKWIVEDRLRHANQRVFLEHGVRVDRAHVRIPCRVDAAVERVRFAAVLLVDDRELGMAAG